GSSLATKGKWDEARDRYERSLALKRAPITLYSLGIAQKNTGQLVEAIESLHAFLAEPLVAATKPYERPAREAIAEIEKRSGSLRITVEPRGLARVVVTVDGQAVPAAALDRPRPVNPGDHRVAASADGRRDADSTVHVDEGGRALATLTLDAL